MLRVYLIHQNLQLSKRVSSDNGGVGDSKKSVLYVSRSGLPLLLIEGLGIMAEMAWFVAMNLLTTDGKLPSAIPILLESNEGTFLSFLDN
jgi:hypothetical protein